jgi:hypothetical protein
MATGLVTRKAQYAGKKTSGEFGSLLMWPELGGRWQLVANQLTSIVK